MGLEGSKREYDQNNYIREIVESKIQNCLKEEKIFLECFTCKLKDLTFNTMDTTLNASEVEFHL